MIWIQKDKTNLNSVTLLLLYSPTLLLLLSATLLLRHCPTLLTTLRLQETLLRHLGQLSHQRARLTIQFSWGG